MEAVCSSITLVRTYHTTRYHNTKDRIINLHIFERTSYLIKEESCLASIANLIHFSHFLPKGDGHFGTEPTDEYPQSGIAKILPDYFSVLYWPWPQVVSFRLAKIESGRSDTHFLIGNLSVLFPSIHASDSWGSSFSSHSVYSSFPPNDWCRNSSSKPHSLPLT
jgi:hypothetical protein